MSGNYPLICHHLKAFVVHEVPSLSNEDGNLKCILYLTNNGVFILRVRLQYPMTCLVELVSVPVSVQYEHLHKTIFKPILSIIISVNVSRKSYLHAGVGVEEHDAGESEHLLGDSVAGSSEVG